MANFDFSDPINSLLERILDTLHAFAAVDEDWEGSQFYKGYPAINPNEVLPYPIVAVWCYSSQTEDTGYDNVFGTNDLPASDPNYEEGHGVAMFIDCYIQIWTTKPQENNPSATGGHNLATRISGKIQTRLRGHTECLGEEAEILQIRDEGVFFPADSNKPQVMYRQLDLQMLLAVPLDMG